LFQLSPARVTSGTAEHVFSTLSCTEDNIFAIFKYFDFKFILKHLITMYYKVKKTRINYIHYVFKKKLKKRPIFYVPKCSPLRFIELSRASKMRFAAILVLQKNIGRLPILLEYFSSEILWSHKNSRNIFPEVSRILVLKNEPLFV